MKLLLIRTIIPESIIPESTGSHESAHNTEDKERDIKVALWNNVAKAISVACDNPQNGQY